MPHFPVWYHFTRGVLALHVRTRTHNPVKDASFQDWLLSNSHMQHIKFKMVGSDGLEPPNSKENRFTVYRRCHLANYPNGEHYKQRNFSSSERTLPSFDILSYTLIVKYICKVYYENTVYILVFHFTVVDLLVQIVLQPN